MYQPIGNSSKATKKGGSPFGSPLISKYLYLRGEIGPRSQQPRSQQPRSQQPRSQQPRQPNLQ